MRKRLIPIAFVLMLAGCSGTGTVAEDFVADASLLLGTPVISATCPAGPCGLSGALVMFESRYPGRLSTNQDKAIWALLNAATEPGGLLDQLKSAASAADRAADLRGVESVINQSLGILANVPNLDADMTFALQSAAVLLPVLELSANQLAPRPSAGAAVVPARFSNPTLTADQARARLRK